MIIKKLPNDADVIIIGGGIIGCSIAYHLTKIGVNNVIILERKQLTCGTTWHAAGLVGQLRASRNMTELAKYSADLFYNLEQETGHATGMKQHGSISLALNNQRFEELKRGASMASNFGLEVDVITPNQILKYWPGVNIDNVVGGVYLPADGQTNPVDTTLALAKGAKMGGAEVFENIEVTKVVTENSKAVGVETAQGYIKATKIIITSGMWSRDLVAKIGVNIPLHAAEHFYIVTDAMDNLSPDLPVMRIPDEYAYYKEDAGKLLLGCFEPIAKPWGMDGIPKDFSFDSLPEDIDHFMPILEKSLERFPALAGAGIQLFFNGPESFTPDDRYMLGETPEVKNLFVATGFNSIGIQSSGGVGKVMAQWVKNNHPPMDLSDVDIRRMSYFQNNKKYLHDRTKESLGLLYAMHWPFYQYQTARNIRRSPFHDRIKDANAFMGETSGWERPMFFAPKDIKPVIEYSYGRQNWFGYCGNEARSCGDNVAIFDQSSFHKFLLKGKDSCKALNIICANNIDVNIGKIVYTQLLNHNGGIEADLTITPHGRKSIFNSYRRGKSNP